MIYIAGTTQGSAPQHISFAQRNLSGLTQSKMSNIPILGRRTLSQLAFDGYKANIDIFLHATAMNQRVSCSELRAHIPDIYVPEVPLRLPKVMFRLAQKKPSVEYLADIAGKMKKFGFEKHESGKGNQIYSVSEPTFALLRRNLPAVCEATCPSADGYCTVEAGRTATQILQVIDLFLRVNSYPYTRTLDGSDKFEEDKSIKYELKIKGAALEGPNKHTKIARVDEAGTRAYKEDGDEMDVEGDVDAVELTHSAEIFTEVLFAKPSPLPSSNNYGTPSSVPFLPGLVFPYFPGMLSGDPSFLRTSGSSLFFRCLTSAEFTAREGFNHYRKSIGTLAYTPEGIIYAHVLKGMELALDTQTQLYLLIDRGTYLGFCLLGGLFAVHINGVWIEPMSADDLQVEVCKLVTHDGHLKALADAMTGYSDYSSGKANGKIKITAEHISTPLRLCEQLARLNIETCTDEDVTLITSCLENLSFRSKYKGVGPETIVWAMELMTTKIDEPLPADLPVHVPTSNFHLLRRREYLVLSSFGSRTFSFVSAGGQEFKIPSPKSKDVLSETAPGATEIGMPMIVVSLKPPQQAMQDWDTMMNKGIIKFDRNERAKGSRCFTYYKQQRNLLWEALKANVAVARDAAGPVVKKRKTETGAVKFGAAAEDIDALEWE